MRDQRLTIGRDKRGSTVVEFAFVAPLLISMLLAVVSYGSIISIENSVQQIVAESARSSIAGLNDSERNILARSYINTAISSYPLLNASKLNIATDTPSSSTFRVQARYDMSGSFVYRLFQRLPLPDPIMTRAAVVQRGGF